jgi:HlyD family secretion protein
MTADSFPTNASKMNLKTAILLPFISTLFFSGCTTEEERADAYGNFEATVTTISAETQGKLLSFNLEEGQSLEAGDYIGLIDTTPLHLQRLQLRAQLGTFAQQLQTAAPDIKVLEDQRANLLRERDRTKRLVQAKAATPRQLDEYNGQIAVVDQQIQAARARVNVANRGILAGRDPLLAQLNIIDDQIRRAYLYNPVAGTVLTKMAEPNEVVAPGSPLYRIADLDTLTLRAYAGSTPLQKARVGQVVEVLIDEGKEAYATLQGTITWISDQAEFTPKTIQTKEERVNLVYAIKVAVPNPEGRLKLGMPAEVLFAPRAEEPTELTMAPGGINQRLAAQQRTEETGGPHPQSHR